MERKIMAPLLLNKKQGGGGVISGYASVFGEVDAQREVVAPGAFARSLSAQRKSGRLPAMLWMHDARQPIGLWDDMHEDARGLAVKGRLALRTAAGAQAEELLRMGAITGLSIGYRTVEARTDAKTRIRTLLDVELFEVSLVTFPANTAARVDSAKTRLPRADDDMKAIIARLNHTAFLLTKD